MCRNIKSLFNLDPPATREEIRASSLQYVRKIAGFSKPSRVNEPAFLLAVDEISNVSSRLLESLRTKTPSRNREELALKLKTRAAQRYNR